MRFLGNPLPDPSVADAQWSDSVLQSLYDAVHAAALSLAGATSLLHEAKVDVVTVPNLSEHLSSAETTEQLSTRFAYAAAMKSMNNLLLLGDGESWSRQTVDFSGLPEMARTFLQVAAGAADIPVTRLLGQSPSGLSATGESDVRNYYDMIAARQELDLRPQLERLDRLICWSEDIDEGALSFAFRPLWQMDDSAKAALALTKAQATQIYAGLGLWPAAVTAKLVEAQIVADGTYPNAAEVFAEQDGEVVIDAREVGEVPRASGGSWPEETEPRDWHGRWTTGAEGSAGVLAGSAARAASSIQASGAVVQLFPPELFFEDPPLVPDPKIPYPTNPALPPGPDYVWRGAPGSTPGDSKGSWYNPKTGESLHPDLNHEEGIDPHYDYNIRGSGHRGWRWFPDGMVPKA